MVRPSRGLGPSKGRTSTDVDTNTWFKEAELDSAQATVRGVYLAGKTPAHVHIFLFLPFEFKDIQSHPAYKNVYILVIAILLQTNSFSRMYSK